MSISRVLAVTVAVVSLAGWSAGQADASILIDDYSVTQTSPGTIIGLSTISSSGVPSGPESLDRTLALGGSGNATSIAFEQRDISDGAAQFALTKIFVVSPLTKTMTISYALGGPINLLGSEGNNALYFSNFNIASTPNVSSFTLGLTANGTSTTSVNLLAAAPGTLVVPFSSFSDASVFSGLSSLSLVISASLGSNASSAVVGWSSLVAAPEPSSMFMAGIGLIGLVGAARRRRSA